MDVVIDQAYLLPAVGGDLNTAQPFFYEQPTLIPPTLAACLVFPLHPLFPACQQCRVGILSA
jgi:hypothetical protein